MNPHEIPYVHVNDLTGDEAVRIGYEPFKWMTNQQRERARTAWGVALARFKAMPANAYQMNTSLFALSTDAQSCGGDVFWSDMERAAKTMNELPAAQPAFKDYLTFGTVVADTITRCVAVTVRGGEPGAMWPAVVALYALRLRFGHGMPLVWTPDTMIFAHVVNMPKIEAVGLIILPCIRGGHGGVH